MNNFELKINEIRYNLERIARGLRTKDSFKGLMFITNEIEKSLKNKNLKSSFRMYVKEPLKTIFFKKFGVEYQDE